MKTIKYLSILIFAVLLCNCNKSDSIGYLFVDGAGYLPNSMVVRAEPDPVLDSKRIKYQTPWFSTEIQGIDGTNPISYEISEIKTSDGDAQSIYNNIEIKGIGILYIPFENTVAPGKYELTLKVSNDNDDKYLEDVFTLIVE